MDFNEEDWMKRMSAAKRGDELAALMMELPDRSLEEMSEEERNSAPHSR